MVIIQGLTGQGLLSPLEVDDHSSQSHPPGPLFSGRQAADQQQTPVVALRSSIVLPTAFSLALALAQAC